MSKERNNDEEMPDREVFMADWFATVSSTLWTIIAERQECGNGISLRQLAKRLDMDIANLSRKLNGSKNLTLRSIGDIMYEMKVIPLALHWKRLEELCGHNGPHFYEARQSSISISVGDEEVCKTYSSGSTPSKDTCGIQ